MEIRITTDGSVGNTELFMNGRKVPFAEFDIMCSRLKKGRGVKMQLTMPSSDGKRLSFNSYYGGDFQKMDDLESLNNEAGSERKEVDPRARSDQEDGKARGQASRA